MLNRSVVPARSRVALASAAAAVAVVMALAAPASAHVTVGADDTRQGTQDVLLTFRVPNERTGATTVKVDIKFPARTPLASVEPAAKPGWTITTTTVTYESPITTDDGQITKGIGQITYTAAAAAAGIPEDRFDTFQVLAGPLPKGVDSLSFPTVQTYSNGQVSSWIEPTAPGSEPEHPAPVLHLSPASADSATAGGAGVAASSPAPGPPASADEVATARTLGLIGVVTGAVALLLGGFALGRARRR
jgi:uncharacterized protein YcnI